MKRFVMVSALGGMVAFGGSVAADVLKPSFSLNASYHALADLEKLHSRKPLSRLAGDCPCRTSTGACRYDDNGRPAANC